jgi:putative SOS response-associated peptidase YedK
MCGRYSFFIPLEQAEQQLQVNAPDWIQWAPRYNAAPSQAMPVITNEFPGVIQLLRWGLVPKWAKDISIGNKMINTRSESITEKPSFKNIFKYKRCLVLADGYYEWQTPKYADKIPKSKLIKQPFRFHLPGDEIMLMAGLWDSWGLDGLQTFSIITCPANADVAPYHDRMPVLLSHSEARMWLDNKTPSNTLIQLLKPAPEGLLEMYAISTYVNKPGNEGPLVIEKINIGQ